MVRIFQFLNIIVSYLLVTAVLFVAEDKLVSTRYILIGLNVTQTNHKDDHHFISKEGKHINICLVDK